MTTGAYGNRPYGLRDLKVTNLAGTLQEDLPAAQTLQFKERIKSGELEGDDALLAIVAVSQGAEWSLEAGGISLAAWGIMTGRTPTTGGASPAETYSVVGNAGDVYPYFKLYGRAISEDAASDIHCKLFKAKIKSLEGTFKNGEFWVTKCDGWAVDDGVSGVFEFIQNETAATLPTT